MTPRWFGGSASIAAAITSRVSAASRRLSGRSRGGETSPPACRSSAEEAVRIDARLGTRAGVLQRRERQRPPFALRTRLRGVDKDAKTPRLQRRAPSNRWSAPSTRSQVSCTTSSATARLGVKIRATRSREKCRSRTSSRTSPRPARSAATSSSSVWSLYDRRSMSDLPSACDAVVIGGGVMGAAALHYLVELGCEARSSSNATRSRRIDRPCAAACVRFLDELKRQDRPRAIARLERFPDEVGAALDLRLYGYLFLARHRCRRRGVRARAHPATGARRRRRFVDPLTFDPQIERETCSPPPSVRAQATSRPTSSSRATRRARRRAVRRSRDRACVGVLVDRGRIVGVETARGRVATTASCSPPACGRARSPRPRARAAARAERRHMFFTEKRREFPEELPLTIDFWTGFYFHREGRLAVAAASSRSRSSRRSARRLPPLASSLPLLVWGSTS